MTLPPLVARCTGKVRHASYAAALDEARTMGASRYMRPYRCDVCGGWHLAQRSHRQRAERQRLRDARARDEAEAEVREWTRGMNLTGSLKIYAGVLS